MSVQFARRMKHVKASEIRELLKVTENPEIISFGGGMPAPELFPVEEMKQVSLKVLEEHGTKALQYASTEGFLPLREKIAERMNTKYLTNVSSDHILITSGSQQGLDFSGKIFLDEGDVVLCESPSYLAAINAFKAYGAQLVEIPTDHDGMKIEALNTTLANTSNVKLIYTIPDFQNPSGRTWSLQRRKEFMEVVNTFQIPVIEDNPYGELRFEGEIPPSLKSMDTQGLVIFLSTFSKIFCPGLRIAWVAAEKMFLEKYILVKQSADLQTSTIGQMEVSKFLDLYDIDAHIAKLIKVYQKRKNLAVKTMQEVFPAEVRFTSPDGGLFTWVELPSAINARDVLVRSLEKKVAFVPGGSCFPNGGKENTLRLNYSYASEDQIVEGLTRLGTVLKEFIG